jgi:integrase
VRESINTHVYSRASRSESARSKYGERAYPEAQIEQNPVRRLSAVKAWYRVPRRQTLIKAHDLKAWWKATDAINEDSRDYLRLLLLTGLRKLEGAKLRRDDIDLKAHTFTVVDGAVNAPDFED